MRHPHGWATNAGRPAQLAKHNETGTVPHPPHLVSRLLSLMSPLRSCSRFDARTLERVVRDAGFEGVEITEIDGVLPLLHLIARAPS